MADSQDMRAIGKLGGLASSRSKLKAKEAREVARNVLGTKFRLSEGRLKESLRSIGIQVEKPIELRAAIISVMSGMALSGNIKAARFVFDIAEETEDSKLTRAKRKMLDKMVDNPDAVNIDTNGEIPTPDELSEIKRQARELGIYENDTTD